MLSTCEFPREFVGCSIPVLSVSFLKPVLQNPGFPRVFCISGQLLWPSVAPVQLGAWRRAALYFASRSQNRVVFRVARVAKSLWFCMAQFGHDPRPWRGSNSNYLGDVLKSGCVETRPKQSITQSNDCSGCKCLISFNFGSRIACVIGCIGAVYRV